MRGQWDYRFSLITGLFQALLQHSAYWFQRSAAAVRLVDAMTALRTPPPR